MTTKIEWTRGADGAPGMTWNPTSGCDRVSPGCDNCYAMTLAKRLKAMGSEKYQRDGDPRTSGPGFGLSVHPDALDIPLRRKKPTTWFVDSMSDLFHPNVPLDFILQVWTTMMRSPQHTFQILTKRPQRMAKIVSSIAWDDHGKGWEAYAWPGRQSGEDHNTGEEFDWYPTEADLDGGGEVPVENCWLGTSIESDRYAFRADHLRATPAAIRFLSLEPLLGPLASLDLTGIDWVIVGGESGPGARPMHPDWVRDIRDRCQRAGVSFFFKQWGGWGPAGSWRGPDHHLTIDGRLFSPGERLGMNHMLQPATIHHWGKKAAGRLLDGRTWDEMPARTA